MQWLKRINTNTCRQSLFILLNQIYIKKEMLLKICTHTHIYVESWINQTLNLHLDVWYFVWALFHLYELLQDRDCFLSFSSYCPEEVCEEEIKPKRNITLLNLSRVFSLSYFPHISIVLSDSLQIYLFNTHAHTCIYIYEIFLFILSL